MALLAKWSWRFKSEKSALWRKVILAIHHKRHSPWIQPPLKKDIPGTWKSICKVSSELSILNLNPSVFMQVDIGDGGTTSFWLDPWIHDIPLCSIFPVLFDQEEIKDCMVADRITINNGSYSWRWRWKCQELSDSEKKDLNDCTQLINSKQWHKNRKERGRAGLLA